MFNFEFIFLDQAYGSQFMEAKAKSWDEIEHFYNDLTSRGWPLQDIIKLIQYVNESNNLRQKLFGCTSLDKLIISIYNPIELDRQALHIQYEKAERLWNFKYCPSPNREVEHERNYPGELLIEKFQDYINLLKW